MKLEKTYLANSENRENLAEYNAICGDPFSWFDTSYFRNENIRVITFDFFINWSDSSFQSIAWVKRLIYDGFSFDPNNIYNAIIKCDGFDVYDEYRRFCEKNNIDLSYVLIPDIPADHWAELSNKVILFNVNQYQRNTENSVKCLNIKELIDLIHTYKVNYYPIGEKGLKLSTSSLEFFLSRKQCSIDYSGDAIYPGDVDIVLFDDNYVPKSIIEIKKHSDGSVKKYKTCIKKETISYYIKDKKKYESLGILQKHWNCDFFMLFYPTNKEKYVKFEKIENSKPIGQSLILNLPEINSPISLRDFCKQFMNYANHKYNDQIITNITSSNMKIYHSNPDCKYIPHNRDIVIYASRQMAEEDGYVFCQLCSNKESI